MPMRLLMRADAQRIPLRNGSVQCVVTSPPYWGLRDYGIAGQLGLERTPEEYVGNMVRVFREVRRVLRDDGTLFLNLGDSYAADAKWGGASGGKNYTSAEGGLSRERKYSGLKPKDLVGIPWRVAFALQADGWYLRSDIIWAKPNPMPESVRDRPTKAHEYLFLLAKSERYYYDAEAIKEPAQDWSKGGPGDGILPTTHYHPDNGGNEGLSALARKYRDGTAPNGRNRRSVWTVATQPYSGAHFATFPEKLVEPCILAGTSAKGCCPECGAPWERVVERVSTGKSYATGKSAEKRAKGLATGFSGYDDGSACPEFKTTGWRPTCDHGKEPTPCRVLDPFAGTATAVRVANRLGRKGIGLDLNAKYLALADHRTSHVQTEFA